MGREDSVAQTKEAQKAKEQAAFEKKQARKDAQWEVGAKDTSKADADAAKKNAAAADKTARRAQEQAEGGGPAPSNKPKPKAQPKVNPLLAMNLPAPKKKANK